MRTAYDIILRPIITEQSMEDLDIKKYAFAVAKDANKIEIKNAIEEIFDVTVIKVTTEKMAMDGTARITRPIHSGILVLHSLNVLRSMSFTNSSTRSKIGSKPSTWRKRASHGTREVISRIWANHCEILAPAAALSSSSQRSRARTSLSRRSATAISRAVTNKSKSSISTAVLNPNGRCQRRCRRAAKG